jgi:hypothetical protein
MIYFNNDIFQQLEEIKEQITHKQDSSFDKPKYNIIAPAISLRNYQA